MSLKSLQEKFPKWNISQTPKGVWVARRVRPIVLTNSRIDQGLRDCVIVESESELAKQLARQEEIDKELESGSKK